MRAFLDLISSPAGQFKPKGSGEWAGPCPLCGGVDRCCAWPERGRWWCRQYGLDSLKEVLAEEGESRVHVDAWRTAFYRNHWGDNTHAKKTAFLRARSDLTRAGLVCVHDDEYFLPSQAEETATGTTGTERHKTGTCAARHTIVEDGTDGTIRHTPPLGGVPCAASVPPRDAREKKKDYVGGLCAAPVPYEEGER